MRDLLMCSRFLFARPSTIEGVARILDFGNTLDSYHFSQTSEEADTLALSADWCAVGHDVQTAIQKLLKRHRQSSLKPPCGGGTHCRMPHR